MTNENQNGVSLVVSVSTAILKLGYLDGSRAELTMPTPEGLTGQTNEHAAIIIRRLAVRLLAVALEDFSKTLGPQRDT